MSSQFNWDQFQTLSAPTTEEPVKDEFQWNQFQTLETKAVPQQDRSLQNVILESVKGLGRVAGRGGAALLSAPSKTLGGALEMLSKVYREDEGFRGTPRRALERGAQFLKETGAGGEAYLNTLLEESLGKPYGTGEEALAQFAERAGDIYGSLPLSGFAGPALAAAGTRQIGKELGAPEGVQDILELIGMGGRDIAKAIPSLVPKKAVEQSGLILPRIADKTAEGWQMIKGKVFPKAKGKAYENVSRQANQLIEEIKQSEIPLSEAIVQGVDIEAKLYNDLNKVEQLASKMDHKIESSFISDYLDQVESNIRKIPVPSTEEEEILRLVDKYRKEYGSMGGSRFYSPEEYLGQFRKINEDRSKLFERAFLEGKKGKTRNFYSGLNKEFTKTLEHGTPKSFSDLFKQSNAEFSQLEKLKSFENILESITDDGIINSSKFSNIFKNPSKAKNLRKQIGDNAFEKMRLISNDLYKVQDKLKMIDELGLKDLIKSGTVSALFTKLGLGKVAIPIQVAKKGADLGYGYFLLSPRGQADFSNFLKAVQSGSKKSIARYLTKMDENALKEEEKK